jgi:hypothetical protein
MIPVIDQAGDVRDVVANLVRLRDPKERNDPGSEAYLMLGATAVGLVPTFGSAAKGALRLVLRDPQATRGALFAVLRRAGRGDPAGFAARHLSADAIYGHAQHGLRRLQVKLAAVLDGVGRLAARFGLADLRAAVAAARRELAEILAAARGGLRAASQTLGDLISKAVGRGDSNAKAAGRTNGRVRAQAEAADPPGGGSGEGPPRAPKPTRTRPTGAPGGKPDGKRTEIGPDEGVEQRRSLTRENESADTLAHAGYRVEQNPPALPSGKRPDYRIEGEYFDCYAPSPGKTPRGVWSQLQKHKLGTGQADRFVVNLDDWGGDTAALREQFASYPMSGLREVIAVRGGNVVPIYP